MSESDNNLQSVLEDCTQVATSWYNIAARLTEESRSLLFKAKEEAKYNISSIEQSPIRMPNTLKLLKTNLEKIQDIIKIETSIERDLEYHRKNMSRFSVTLFGRTMAGKSTLMEILTHGNGQSIGLGAQRTTRDVRHYIWNHLDITDVPGIAAVDGQEDADIAFCEAKKADMILFLLTDDGPQESEAEWFSQLIKLGKPILCAINVKAAMPEGKSPRFIEKQIERRFDMERLETLRRQFLEFAPKYDQSWERIPFVYVHLKSAFAAQQTDDLNIAERYQQISRIGNLTDHIIEIVKTRGRFYRMKNFADIISKPMIDALDILYGFARECCKSYMKIDRTILDVQNWRDNEYIPDATQEIRNICQKIRDEFERETSCFADENYENPKAETEWENICSHIGNRHQFDASGLAQFAYERMKQFSENIITPEQFIFELPTNSFEALKFDSISKTKEHFRSAFSTLATLAVPAAWIGGPIVGGVVAIGAGITGLTSLFLNSKERKIQDRKKAIDEELNRRIQDICVNLENDMNRFLREIIVTHIIDNTLNKMQTIRDRQFDLYHGLLQLASKLNKVLCTLHKDIVREAFLHCGLNAMDEQIQAIARIPGNAVLIEMHDETAVSRVSTEALRALMAEDIQVSSRIPKISSQIADILDIEEDRIKLIDGATRIKPSSKAIDTAKIQLAQQIADVPIWILKNRTDESRENPPEHNAQ